MKPTYETLLALAESLDRYATEMRVFEVVKLEQPTLFTRVSDALSVYRAELRPPLRTREEIALELATKLGCSAYDGGPGKRNQLTFNVPDGVTVPELLHLLIDFDRAEPTSGPSSVDATDPPPVPVSPVGADYLPDPEAVTDAGIIGTCHGCGLKNMHCLPIGWKNLCADCRALPDPEPCSCDEANALKMRIERLVEGSKAKEEELSALRARNFDLSTHLSFIRKLARSLEVTHLFDEIDREP